MLKKRIKVIPIAVLIFISINLSNYSAAQMADKVVKIDSGQIEGAISGDVLSFKGIPYAAPPIGNLRWRSPQPVQSWMGVRQTIKYGNDCMQHPDPSDAAPLGTTPAEDCLAINVWRPARIKPGEKLPVAIWIYGGAYVNGGSSTPIYDGSAFARQGIVFVSFNYRLGRFGFFAHPALTAAKEGTIGNYAYMDQLEALQWVRRNISAFDGNPDRVTLIGESAGGISVMHLLTWQAARGLFHQAVILSGGGRNYLTNVRKLSESTSELSSAEESGIKFGESIGLEGTGTTALAALRALPAEKVTGNLNMTSLIKKPPTYTGGPILDGQIVTATPGEILRRGNAVKIPIIIGSTSNDLPAILPPLKDPLSYFGADAAKALAVYNPKGTLKPLDLVLTIGTDMAMHEPARFVAKQMTAAGQSAWLYRFDYVAQSLRPKVTGASHASELPFLFDTLDARYGKNVNQSDREVGRRFRSYIVNFVKTGNPNGIGLSTWAKFDPARSDVMMFASNSASLMQVDPWKERLDLVERAAEWRALASNTVNILSGTSWQLVKFQGGDGKILMPDNKAKYTIAFNSNNEVNVRFDCNRGQGTWKSSGPNQLQFGILATTLAACPTPLNDRIGKDWGFVRSYVIKDGRLFLSLMADGGIYEFEPLPRNQHVLLKR
jgi:para-nitrobenzyl esterase